MKEKKKKKKKKKKTSKHKTFYWYTHDFRDFHKNLSLTLFCMPQFILY